MLISWTYFATICYDYY